jgi:tetratricopeptide (TPR) repeat protein
VEENPTDTAALLELANLYEGRRQLAEAADTLQRYVELRPGDVDALRQLSAVYDSRVGQLQTQQGLLSSLTGPESFNTTVFSFPESTGFIGAVGQDPIVEAQSADTQAAVARLTKDLEDVYAEQVATYEQIAELTPDDPQAFLLLGQAASQTHENEKAIEAYERFLELDPENTLAAGIKEQIDLLKEDVQVVNG